MNSLYADPEIAAGYLNLMKLWHAASQSPDQADMVSAACETFFESLIWRAYASLQDILPQPLPELHLHAWQGELDMLARLNAEATFVDPYGVHVGLDFVSELDAALLVLSAYLMDNYLWQVSPLEVDMLPVSEPSGPYDTLMPMSLHGGGLSSVAEVVGLADFPAEALNLYSARLIPEAEARDGYQKRPFQLIMECFQEARFAADRRDGHIRTLPRAIPKPLIDLTDFCDRFDPGEAVQAYLDSDNGPYLLRLHLQLLLDGLYFLLAHEVEHYRLGHLEHRNALVLQVREEEAAADTASLTLLRGVPGFQPRSLIIIFNFARSVQPDTPPDHLDHPLAHNRLLILTKTLLAEPGGDALRADVNAGLALLPSRFESQYLTFGWPDEAPEDVDIYISSYSDMDYTAHMMVYIDRPPRHPERMDGFTENAFLLSLLAYRIDFEVRDRVDPEKVYTWGGAGYQPTIRPEDLYTANRAATVFSRLHFSIPAPPEFCLKWPDAEFAIKKIEVFYHEPDVRSREEGRNQPRFFYSPVDLDLNNLLLSLPDPDQDLTWRNRFLLAARRYLGYQQSDASVQIYQWLYRQDPESLPYGDLVNLVAQLMDFGRFAEAAEIARWAVGPGRVQRPRFHYILAMDHATHEDAQEAFEEIFLEMALFGEYGEMFDDAREMCGKIASYAGDPVMAALRDFTAHSDAASQSRDQGKHEHALAEFRAGRDALLVGQRQAHRHFVFLSQLLSDVTLAISELEGKGFDTAMEAAQAVLALWPDFVPALMNLARITLLQGDRKMAHALWQQAHVTAPFNSLVFEKREEFEYGLS